jgi:poly(A) polymerase
VESRIRQLVMKLELVDTIDIAHPFVKGFDRTYHCASPDEVTAIARGEVPEAVSKRQKEELEGQEGAATVYATSFFIGLEIQPKKGSMSLLKGLFAHIPFSGCRWSSQARYFVPNY